MSTLPLVLLPGTLCDERLWEAIKPHLPPELELICPRYNQGETMSGVVANLLADLPPRFALAGFSLGGLAALELISQAPGSVDRLALISSHAYADSREAEQLRLQQLQQAYEQGLESLVSSTFIPTGLTASHPGFSASASLLRKMASDSKLTDFDRQIGMAITRDDRHRALAAFTQPTLIMAGSEDKMCTRDKPLSAFGAKQDARLVWIENAGHYLPLEQPLSVAQELCIWLEEGQA